MTKVKNERKARKAKQESSADSLSAINVRRAEVPAQSKTQKHESNKEPVGTYSKEYLTWLNDQDILERYRLSEIRADGISGLTPRVDREPFKGQKYTQQESTAPKEEPYVPQITQNTTRIRERGRPGDDPSSSSSSTMSSLTPSSASRRSQRPKVKKESSPERETPRPERRLRDTFRDRVGKAVTYDPAVVKLLKPSPPEKYNGEDDIEVFENWLAALLRYFRISGLGGRANDQLRVDLTGTNLKGLASDWFHTEVESWDRETLDWNFMDLICALYKHFIHQVTAQNATDKFYSVRYNKSEGALAFFNALYRNAA